MNNATHFLEKLADKLGTTIEYLWGVLIQQATYSAIFSTISLVLIIISSYFMIRSSIKANNNNKFEGKHFIFTSVSIILILLGILCAYDAYIGFINPEYWALKQLIE